MALRTFFSSPHSLCKVTKYELRRLGEVMDSKASNKYMGKKVDGEGRPIAIYKFKYRSEGKSA